ncbi:hypothetical protein [Streptomyces antibioticus]|uniref:hypothetical protein n=1 Tax=Streptomyces antibioticus TaxID=1890 RepID=UPI0036F6FF90
MSAPAAHRPTPADLARPRPKPPTPTPKPAASRPSRPPRVDGMVTAADAVRQGQLHHGELLRQMFEQGIRISAMNANTRLVALTLLGYANFRTGEIHTRWRPAPEQLAIATGLSTDQIHVQLRVLTDRGWLTEFTLATGPRAGQPCWRLGIPMAVLQQLRDRAARHAKQDR